MTIGKKAPQTTRQINYCTKKKKEEVCKAEYDNKTRSVWITLKKKKKKINQNKSQSRLISKDQLLVTSHPWPFLSQVSLIPGSVNRLMFNIIHLPFQREALSTIRNSKKLQLCLYELQLVTAVLFLLFRGAVSWRDP